MKANYSKFLEIKGRKRRNGTCIREKTSKCSAYGIRMGKKRLPCKNNKTACQTGEIEALKNTAAPVGDQSVELESVETRMGKKTIELKHVSKKYGNQVLVEDFN